MKSLIFTLIFFISGFVLCQDNPTWVSRYNGLINGIDETTGLAVDNSGNVYVTGRSQVTGGTYDYVTIKYNSNGDTAWLRRFNGTGNNQDFPEDLTIDNLGNVYVTGMSIGILSNSDYVTIKYSSNGDVVWIVAYNGPNNLNDHAYSITIDENYNVYVTGTSGYDPYLYDITTVKYNSSGTQLWVSTYNGLGNGLDNGVKIIYKSGSLYVTGTSWHTPNSSTSTDIVTIKYNVSGDSTWVRRFNGPANNYDEVKDMVTDNIGNVYVTGLTRSTPAAETADYVTIKYSIIGDSLWVKKYNGPGNSTDESNSVAVDNTGNVYVTGVSVAPITGYDYATIKYNSSGAEQWVQRYNGTQPAPAATDHSKSLALDYNGNIYVTGFSQGLGTQSDYVTIRYNPAGTQEWLHRYNGTGNNGDAAYYITLDNSGYVYVTGNSMNAGLNVDYTTIKYDKLIGIKITPGEIPNSFKLEQNFPNPFNPVTNIRFQIPKTGFVKLIVFDVSGKEIETLIEQNLNAGTYNFDWDAKKYSSGVYYYKIKTEEYTETKKMVLIK